MPSEPLLFPEELGVIRDRLAEGKSYRAIARELDRDVSTVARNARRNGWQKIPQVEMDGVIGRRLSEGASYRAIGKELGRCHTFVRYRAKVNGWRSKWPEGFPV